MRNVARFAVVGLFFLSCIDLTGPSGPQGCTTPPDTIGLLTGGPLRLGVGGADNRTAAWELEDCFGVLLIEPASGATWLLRDTGIAQLLPALNFADPATARTIVARRPGSTFVVIQVPGRLDSVSLQVVDTSAVGAVTSLSAAGGTSCAIDVTNTAFCWGARLATISPAAATTCFGAPCSPMPAQAAADARSVHIGPNRWCYILTSGPLVCSDTVAVPTSVSFVQVTLGVSHTCGLDAEGKAYCWGKSITNLFGDAPGAPAVQGNHRWTSLASHGDRACGVNDAGALLCWGLLANPGVPVPGSIGCTVFSQDKGGGTTTTVYPCSSAPLRMALETQDGTDTTFAEVNNRCARTGAGRVFCHDPATGRFRVQPTVVPFQSIAVGSQHGCGLDADGSAWCWGENFYGQLGDGSTVARPTPVRVAGSHTFVQLVAGDTHTCGRTAAADVWCWGNNSLGQTGTPILTNPSTPVRVRGQP